MDRNEEIKLLKKENQLLREKINRIKALIEKYVPQKKESA